MESGGKKSTAEFDALNDEYTMLQQRYLAASDRSSDARCALLRRCEGGGVLR